MKNTGKLNDKIENLRKEGMLFFKSTEIRATLISIAVVLGLSGISSCIGKDNKKDNKIDTVKELDNTPNDYKFVDEKNLEEDIINELENNGIEATFEDNNENDYEDVVDKNSNTTSTTKTTKKANGLASIINPSIQIPNLIPTINLNNTPSFTNGFHFHEYEEGNSIIANNNGTHTIKKHIKCKKCGDIREISCDTVDCDNLKTKKEYLESDKGCYYTITTCNDCGQEVRNTKKTPVEHHYNETTYQYISNNDGTHQVTETKNCSECKYVSKTIKNETCINKSDTKHIIGSENECYEIVTICTDCNQELNRVKKNFHNFGTSTYEYISNNDGTHKIKESKTCLDCGYLSETLTNESCSKTTTREVLMDDKDKGCYYTVTTCNDCEQEVSNTKNIPVDHDFDVNGDCKKPGCGYHKTHDHVYETENDVFTYESNGSGTHKKYVTHKCSTCGREEAPELVLPAESCEADLSSTPTLETPTSYNADACYYLIYDCKHCDGKVKVIQEHHFGTKTYTSANDGTKTHLVNVTCSDENGIHEHTYLENCESIDSYKQEPVGITDEFCSKVITRCGCGECNNVISEDTTPHTWTGGYVSRYKEYQYVCSNCGHHLEYTYADNPIAAIIGSRSASVDTTNEPITQSNLEISNEPITQSGLEISNESMNENINEEIGKNINISNDDDLDIPELTDEDVADLLDIFADDFDNREQDLKSSYENLKKAAEDIKEIIEENENIEMESTRDEGPILELIKGE